MVTREEGDATAGVCVPASTRGGVWVGGFGELNGACEGEEACIGYPWRRGVKGGWLGMTLRRRLWELVAKQFHDSIYGGDVVWAMNGPMAEIGYSNHKGKLEDNRE